MKKTMIVIAIMISINIHANEQTPMEFVKHLAVDLAKMTHFDKLKKTKSQTKDEKITNVKEK